MVRLVVGEGAATIRREVGATSWAALEELAARDSDSSLDGLVSASVRDIADELGVSKNTAHRAIRRLVDAGLVAPIQDRSTDGRFLAGTYRLSVPTGRAPPRLPTNRAPPPVPTGARSTTRRHHTDDSTQLSLLTP